MPWIKGVNQQDNWVGMDVPPWTGTCTKFQKGRLLMQRYQWVSATYSGHVTYGFLAQRVRDRSKILAQRMQDHARNCAICTREQRLSEEDFYGVYK
jgi:hypothetical protein